MKTLKFFLWTRNVHVYLITYRKDVITYLSSLFPYNCRNKSDYKFFAFIAKVIHIYMNSINYIKHPLSAICRHVFI